MPNAKPEILDCKATACGFGVRLVCRTNTEAVIGCHWLDPATGRFLKESDWARSGPDGAGTMDVALPQVPGEYRLCVSTQTVDGGWSYTRGGTFFAVDVGVGESGAAVEQVRRTTLRRLRGGNWPRAIVDLLTGPFQMVTRHRQLMLSLVRRDILSRYRGSFADAFWALLNPLLLMLTYFFVFGIVLQTRFAGDPSRHGFVLFFLAGMIPWLAMNESIARAPNTAMEHRNLITKLIFPVEVLPFNLALAGLVTGLTVLVFFLIYLSVVRGGVPSTALYLPVVILPQFLLTAGICYWLAAWSVFLRDLVYVMGLLLTMWFFLTPICYPDTALPAQLLPLLGKNPLYILVRAYRAILIEGNAPEWGALGRLYAVSVVMFYCGFAFFKRSRPAFADIL
jgi:lipopolysaccharide transport system permease protein